MINSNKIKTYLNAGCDARKNLGFRLPNVKTMVEHVKENYRELNVFYFPFCDGHIIEVKWNGEMIHHNAAWKKTNIAEDLAEFIVYILEEGELEQIAAPFPSVAEYLKVKNPT